MLAHDRGGLAGPAQNHDDVAAAAAVGTEFTADIRGRGAAARVVPTPFYKRPR